MKLVDAVVAANMVLSEDVNLLRLEAPEVAREAKPGQFIQVWCTPNPDASRICMTGASLDPLLRRPMSICRIGRPDGTHGECRTPLGCLADGQLELDFRRVGRGTALLSTAQPGDRLSVLGPLGHGFTLLPRARNVLLVAGGLGLAPLVPLADQALKRRGGANVTVLAGFLTAERMLPATFLPPEVEYATCTEDGTGQCHRGVVTDLLPQYLPWADQIFACGPLVMLDALRACTVGSNVPVQVAIESRMACGVGACLACTVKTKKGLKRVCREGPVFDLRELDL